MTYRFGQSDIPQWNGDPLSERSWAGDNCPSSSDRGRSHDGGTNGCESVPPVEQSFDVSRIRLVRNRRLQYAIVQWLLNDQGECNERRNAGGANGEELARALIRSYRCITELLLAWRESSSSGEHLL